MREDYFYTEGLTVGYQGVPLIREIAFQLKKGEILTLIGPNGAGKTTISKESYSPVKATGRRNRCWKDRRPMR